MFICIFHYCWLYLFIEVVMLYLFIEVVRLCPSGFVVSREWSWVAYVLPECWFISVPANFRFSICPLFSKGHAEIFREFRHDLCYKLGHIECPGFAAPGRSQRSCKTIGLFYVIIHFIRSRINWLDLIVGNMASNDEGQGSGDCDDVYRAADEFLSLADDQPMLLLGPPAASGTKPDFISDVIKPSSSSTS